MTELVRQRLFTDCVPCCLAMHTGLSYETVIEKIGDLFVPEGDEAGVRNEAAALERLGLSNEYVNGDPVGDFVSLYRNWAMSTEAFLFQCWGRRALISVPSLNVDEGWHMVYYDGHKLFDPSTRKTYASMKELKPNYMTLFRER